MSWLRCYRRSWATNVERFRREIQIAASLQHPNIVLGVGEVAGLPYYTMPFVAGPSLREGLDRNVPMSLSKSVAALRDIARALAYAHRQGIVHRDVKPDGKFAELWKNADPELQPRVRDAQAHVTRLRSTPIIRRAG